MAELTVSVRMPKSEFTEAAQRQRQACLVSSPICTIICTIIRTIVGTITSPAGSLASGPAGYRARVIGPAGSLASRQAGYRRRVIWPAGSLAIWQAGTRAFAATMKIEFELVCPLSYYEARI